MPRKNRTPPLATYLLVEPSDLDSAITTVLPPVFIKEAGHDSAALVRRHQLAERLAYKEQHREALDKANGQNKSATKDDAHREAAFYRDRGAEVEVRLTRKFIKQHSPDQFLSPYAFFTTQLFNVRNRAQKREKEVQLALPTHEASAAVSYRGPELRQSDGLVFLSLLNMLRDVEVGTVVSFSPEALCRAIWGRYDGKCRRQLLEHIYRLQRGLIIYQAKSVQLCQKFEFPTRGLWSVALDRDIVNMFSQWTEVWMSLPVRLSLRDGLATWLYGYIESQSKLIPTQVDALRAASGSNAGLRAFTNVLRAALSELVLAEVIDDRWSISKGLLRWMKGRRRPATPTSLMLAAQSPQAGTAHVL